MRRNYISPEFKNTQVFGTLNMLEESNFFGAKMLEIEDSILINNENVIWQQMPNGEQIDFDTESTFESQFFSSSEFMQSKHTLRLDETQTQYTRDNATKWIIDVDLNSILVEYIFSQLKRYRTFEGVRANMTIYNDINLAVRDYVQLNVVNRYKLSRFDLYVKYVDLRSQNMLRFANNWDLSLAVSEYANRKFQSITDYNQKKIRVLFSQEKPSTQFKFDYYFNLFFEKI